MFSGEWEIKSSTKLAVKEAAQYRETILGLVTPWQSASVPSSPTPLQLYMMETIKSITMRCVSSIINNKTRGSSSETVVVPSTASADLSLISSIADLWNPSLFTMLSSDLPEALIPSSKLTVDRSGIRDATGKTEVQAFQANSVCLSFVVDPRQQRHQLTLFFYYRVRYLLEKLLVRLLPKLIETVVSNSSRYSEIGNVLVRKQKKLCRLLHHCIYTNLFLTRPSSSSISEGGSSLGAIMTTNQIATKYVLEGRTLMGPAVGIFRVAASDPATVRKCVTKELNLTIVSPGQSFPFATGTIGYELYSAALNAVNRGACPDRSLDYYFGEELHFKTIAVCSNECGDEGDLKGPLTSTATAESSRLGFSLYSDDLDSTGLKGHGFIPVHVAYDGLWELFWPAYSSYASRSDGVRGDWLVPEALQATVVLEREDDLFSEGGEESDDEVDTLASILDPISGPRPPMPTTMDEALSFAFCESIKELQQRHRAVGTEVPLKVPIISLLGLYLKRHSPRIPAALRSVELGGPKAGQNDTSATLPMNEDEAAKPQGDDDNDNSDDEGKPKLSKAEKMMKRKAEKESKNASKSGGGGKKTDKKGANSAAVAVKDDTTLSSDEPKAVNNNFAVPLDFKASTYKKATTFFKDVAQRSNGAYFTVPNDNEIQISTQKAKLTAATAFNILRDHKKRFGDFIRLVHQPLIEYEEALKEAEEFATIGGGGGDDSRGSDVLEDEAKATVSSIAQFYGFTGSVNAELAQILTGRWRPAASESAATKKSSAASDKDDEVFSDDDQQHDGNEAQAIAQLIQTSNVSSAAHGTPTVLHPHMGLKGKPFYSKAALLKNLKYYVLASGLFYADDVPVEESKHGSSETEKLATPADADDRFPTLGAAHSEASELRPAWQRAMLKREAEREAERKRAEEEAALREKERQQQAKPTSQATSKGPMMVHLDALLAECMRVSYHDRVMDMPTFFNSFTYRLLMPQTRIVAQSPHRVRTLWLKGSLPTVLIKEKKRPGNRTVVYVVGVDDFGLSLRALAHRFKKEMACSVACEVSPPALGKGTRMCLVLTGKLSGAVRQALQQLGVPAASIVDK